jgi:group I intron endonuclease
MFVYIIINDVNGKYYIGKTVSNNLQKYLNDKVWDAFNRPSLRSHLYAAVRKHGPEHFSIHPLISTLTTNEDLCFYETVLIAQYDAQNPEVGYNICRGGEGFTGPQSESARKKISETSKKMWQRPGHSENFVAKVTGKIRSPEALANYRNSDYITARRGSTLPEETKVKISESLTGLTRSVESRGKQSASVLGDKNHFFGKSHTEETRKKMRQSSPHLSGEHNPFYGHTHSEESRQRIRENSFRPSNKGTQTLC